MKKTLLAASLMVAYAAVHAQSSVTIYGIMDAGATYSDKVASGTGTTSGRQFGIGSGLLQSSRFGLRGSEDLGGGLNATFSLEQGVGVDQGTGGTSTKAWSRRSVVGLSGKTFGTLDVGWRKDFLDDVGNFYGSVTPFGTFIYNGSLNNLNRASGGSRATNMVYYATGNFSGLRAYGTVGLGETSGSKRAGSAWGGGANYDGGIFSVGGGYWQSMRGTGTGAATSADQAAPNSVGCNGTAGGVAGDVCLTTWTIGAKVNAGPVLARGMYSLVKHPLVTTTGAAAPNFATTFTSSLGTGAFTSGGPNNTKGQLLDVGLDYKLSAPALLKVSYLQSQYDFLGASSKGKVRQLTVGGEYYLSKRTTVYATAASQSADAMYTPGILGTVGPGRDSKVAGVGAGMRHTF